MDFYFLHHEGKFVTNCRSNLFKWSVATKDLANYLPEGTKKSIY